MGHMQVSCSILVSSPQCLYQIHSLNVFTGDLLAKAVRIFLNNLNNIIPIWVIKILADIQIFLQFRRITIIDKSHQVIPFGIFL